MASDGSLQFKEPASHPHVSDMLHPSSNTDDSTVKSSGTVDPKHNSASTHSPPPLDRQSSMSKIAQVAKHLVKSPAEEVEHKQLEKTLSKEAKKGEVDVSVMEA
ncbi:hypothetical protein N0V87_008272 [Didymella glomerata]|uniref:Uncharacterized protein n=1 Tax=Didymella glomerata TaxID=749621 RepID=A0A9W8WTB8_9PLEO|nr:hypothetical protein N0V87_008272 [Didymella glomerata]